MSYTDRRYLTTERRKLHSEELGHLYSITCSFLFLLNLRRFWLFSLFSVFEGESGPYVLLTYSVKMRKSCKSVNVLSNVCNYSFLPLGKMGFCIRIPLGACTPESILCLCRQRSSEGPQLCPKTLQKIKQDRQCTYNVTLRRVHETIVAVEKQ